MCMDHWNNLHDQTKVLKQELTRIPFVFKTLIMEYLDLNIDDSVRFNYYSGFMYDKYMD